MKTINEYLVNNHITNVEPHKAVTIKSEKDLVPGCYWEMHTNNILKRRSFGRLDSKIKYRKNKAFYNNYYYCDYNNFVFYKKGYGRVGAGNIYSNISDEYYNICLQIEDFINKNEFHLRRYEKNKIGSVRDGLFIPDF